MIAFSAYRKTFSGERAHSRVIWIRNNISSSSRRRRRTRNNLISVKSNYRIQIGKLLRYQRCILVDSSASRKQKASAASFIYIKSLSCAKNSLREQSCKLYSFLLGVEREGEPFISTISRYICSEGLFSLPVPVENQRERVRQ